MGITRPALPPPPAGFPPFAAAPPGVHYRPQRAPGTAAKRILVIDDEPDIHRFLSDFLATEGYAVTCASGWREAVTCLVSRTPDLIILDILMPEVNGFIVAETLKQEMAWSVPVLVYSALNQPHDIMLGLSKGGNAFLSKPAPLPQLRATIASLLAEPASDQPVRRERQGYGQAAAHQCF